MLKTFAVLPFLLSAPAALAQATPEGAADLAALFQTYLGATPGVVTVTPEGAAYALTLDPAPLIALIPAEAQASLTMSPYRMMLTDNGDGTWAVTQDQPMSFAMGVPGALDMTIEVASVTCDGVFDAALKAFATNTCDLADLRMVQTVTDPQLGDQAVDYKIASMTYATTAVAGAAGGVDGTVSYVVSGLDQTVGLPTGPGAPPQTLRITVDRYVVDGTSAGFRTEAFLSLIAWVVAHPGEAAMMADKAGLKAILAEGLPFFDHLAVDGTATTIAVETPFGPVAIAEAGVDVELRGAVADGLFREAIRVKGITPPPGVLPPFAEPLLPQEITLDFSANRFDAAAAAQVLLGLFDLPDGADPGPEFEGALMSALMPEGTIGLTLAPGVVSNAMYRLTYEGAMTVGPAAPPVGTARITATGFDDAVTVLDGAPQEVKGDILPVMGIARGLAQQGPDGLLIWDIDATTPGTLLINGMDLMQAGP